MPFSISVSDCCYFTITVWKESFHVSPECFDFRWLDKFVVSLPVSNYPAKPENLMWLLDKGLAKANPGIPGGMFSKWIHLMYLSGKETIESVWKGKSKLGRWLGEPAVAIKWTYQIVQLAWGFPSGHGATLDKQSRVTALWLAAVRRAV